MEKPKPDFHDFFRVPTSEDEAFFLMKRLDDRTRELSENLPHPTRGESTAELDRDQGAIWDTYTEFEIIKTELDLVVGAMLHGFGALVPMPEQIVLDIPNPPIAEAS